MRKSRFKQKRSEQRWRFVGYGFLYLFTLSMVGVGGYYAYQHLLRNSKFNVNQVVVQGCSPFNFNELQTSLADFKGHNIFLSDLKAIQKAAEQHAWVADAVIRRELPNRIRVSLTERVAGGLVLDGKTVYVVDRQGALLGALSPEMGVMDFPVLTGIDVKNRAKVRAALALTQEIQDSSLLFWSQLDRLDFSNPNNTVAHLNHFRVPLYLGKSLIAENVANFLSIAEHLQQTYAELAYVELGFPGQVTVMLVKVGS